MRSDTGEDRRVLTRGTTTDLQARRAYRGREDGDAEHEARAMGHAPARNANLDDLPHMPEVLR